MSWTIAGVVHPVAVLVDRQAQAAPDLLAPRNGVVAVLEHAHDEDVGVVPAFAQRGVGEDEPHWLRRRTAAAPCPSGSGHRRPRRPNDRLVAGPPDLSADSVCLLVDREIALVRLGASDARQVLPVRRSLSNRQLGQIFRLEQPRTPPRRRGHTHPLIAAHSRDTSPPRR